MTMKTDRDQALDVSVIVCCYNADRTIGDTLDSLVLQTHPAREILVIDDGSTDRSAEIVAERVAHDPRIRLLRNPSNKGTAYSRQRGLEEAISDAVLFFDADDIATPHLLEKQAKQLMADPSLLGVGCYATYFASETRAGDLGLQRIGPTDRGAALGLYSRNKLVFMAPVTMFWRRDALAVGGYRQNLLPNAKGLRYEDYAEDLDLWCRMADFGADGRYFLAIPEPLFFYRKPMDSLSTRNVAVMQLKMRWIKDCMIRRRKRIAERSLGEFIASRTRAERWTDWRSDRAAIFYKRAGFAFASRRYLRMGLFLSLVAMTSPKLIFQKFKTQSVLS